MDTVGLPPGGVYRAGRPDNIERFPAPLPAIDYATATTPIHDGPRWEDSTARFATMKFSPTAEVAITSVIARYRSRIIPPDAPIVADIDKRALEDPFTGAKTTGHAGSGVIDLMKRFLTGPPAYSNQPELAVAIVPPDVLDHLALLHIPHDPSVVFVDLEARETHETLEHILREHVRQLGLGEFDGEGLARERDRRLTRLAVGTIYDYCNYALDSQIAGIRLGAHSGEPSESFIYWSDPCFVDLASDALERRWVPRGDAALVAAADRLELRLPD